MKPRLYLETTIPSYLAAEPSRTLRVAADQETTHLWWNSRRSDFEVFISQAVLDEVRRGDQNKAEARLALLRDVPLLADSTLALQLARHLLTIGIIPPTAAGDAVHLAVAASHGMDFLLTWNCRHLNNRSLERRILKACKDFGVDSPVICNPSELMVM